MKIHSLSFFMSQLKNQQNFANGSNCVLFQLTKNKNVSNQKQNKKSVHSFSETGCCHFTTPPDLLGLLWL